MIRVANTPGNSWYSIYLLDNTVAKCKNYQKNIGSQFFKIKVEIL